MISKKISVDIEPRTMTHVNPIVEDILKTIANEQKYVNYKLRVTPLTTDGGNYSSNLFNATITNDEEDLNLFVKVAAAGEMLRAQISTKLYVGEHHVYSNLVTIYQQLEDSHNVPKEHRIVFPKLFACNSKIPNETVVLENLATKGFRTHDRFKSVEWEYAAAAVEELAKLHALSIAYQHQRPDEFDTMLEDLDLGWTDDNCPLEALLKAGLTASIAVIKEEHKDKCRNFFNNDVKKIMSYYKPLRRTVIAHGDFRPGNLMHKVQQDGRFQVIVVDYQTMQAASPVIDLLYFIFTGTDEQFRAQHYQRLLDHYHAQLSLALRRLHLDPDEKYSREDFEYELKEKLPYGLIAALYMLPTGTIEVENIPKINEDMELSSFSIQTTGKLFPERINGIVSDFVKWGVLK